MNTLSMGQRGIIAGNVPCGRRKKSKRKKSGTYGNTTKGIAKGVEKKFSTYLTMESTEAL